MTDPALLRRQRAGHRSVATRRIKEVDDLIAASPDPDMVKLEQLKLGLHSTLDSLRDVNKELMPHFDPGDIATEIEQSEKIRDDLFGAIAKIERALKKPARTRSSTPSGPVAVPPITAKLPKLTLKGYNGSLMGWSAFWDAYKTAVHDNPSLGNVDKFAYLMSLLEGTAKEAVAGLALTDVNYAEAIAILERRFGDKERIKACHIEQLMRLESVSSEHHLVELRRLYDKTESNIRGLKTLGVAADAYGTLFIPIFMKKLPQELKLSLTRKISTAEWSIDKILEVLRDELEARERALGSETRNRPKPAYTSNGSNKRGKDYPTTGAYTSSGEGGCCYCKHEGHSPSNCRRVTNIDERKRLIRESGRCFNCLRKGHIGRDCHSSSRCSNCNGRHHTSICMRAKRAQSSRDDLNSSKPSLPTQKTLDPEAPPYKQPEPSTTCCASNSDAILLQTAKAFVFNLNQPSRKIAVHILMDSGSQCSYITEQACRKLRLKSLGTRAMRILTFGSRKESKTNCTVVRVGLETRDGSHLELKLLSVRHICEPINHAALDLNIYTQFKELDLAMDYEHSSQIQPDILIGSDQYWTLATGEVVKETQGPAAFNTRLGWILSGPVIREGVEPHTTLVTHVLRADGICSARSLDKELHSFWNIESMGIVESEDIVQNQFHDNVSFENGRYTVSLPWKESELSLPDNYQISLRRLKSLYKRLKRSPELLEKYDSIIREQLALGIIEPADESSTFSRIHYLPHHAVVRQDKSTTKLRIVYDASAKEDGPSLNDCLYTGPPLHKKIFDLLLRFRTQPVALIADIEKAFLMIKVKELDQEVLRFLWYRDIREEKPELKAYKFTRVVFGVSPSPYLLNATIDKHLGQFEVTFGETVERIRSSIYVDDIITGFPNAAEAFQFFKDSRHIFKQGGFNLRKFMSNNKELQMLMDQELTDMGSDDTAVESYAKTTLGGSNRTLGDQKVLGIAWNMETDHLIIDLQLILQEAELIRPTKRNIISVVSKIYDPMGLISPVVIEFKIFFQELCQAKLEWDELLSESMRERWEKLLSGLRVEQPLRISRCFGTTSSLTWRLFGFCDASVRAYAAVIYVDTGEGDLNLVASKTRVAPIQTQTVPRLELLGALLLARLMESVRSSLDGLVGESLCFTDSQIVLYWIRGIDKNWKPFVQNRVREIRDKVPNHCWHHCHGETNPADQPSRGLTLRELQESVMWFNGPSWTRENVPPFGTQRDFERDTPPMRIEGEVPLIIGTERKVPPFGTKRDNPFIGIESDGLRAECLEELRVKDRKMFTMSVGDSLIGVGSRAKIESIMDIKHFSSYERLINSTAYVLTFLGNLKKKLKSTDEDTREPDYEEYLRRAEVMWIGAAQRDRMKRDWMNQFTLYLDSDGIWRCRGRLGNADLPYNTKHPVILPRDHPFTTLVVRRAHQRVIHSGVKDTLNEVRSRFWIPQGRAMVRSFIHQCVICRRYAVSSYKAPPAPLPDFRVQQSHPFTSVGVDYAGPLMIKHHAVCTHTTCPTHTSYRGKQNTYTLCNGKAWVCLFTCCVTRAVHLEVVTDLSSQSFLKCLKRFISRRGLPSRIVSDNGTTFKGAAKSIRAIMEHPEVQRFVSGVNIKWSFNIERAPWWGGFFERMIQLMKRCLRKLVGQAKLTYEELITGITEVELILNSRPLTYMSSTDLDEPITPSHLILGRRLLDLPDYLCTNQEDEDYNSTYSMSRRMKYLNTILNHFWSRWRREYLTELREGHRRSCPDESNITAGDVVIVHDDTHRGLWRLGVVEKTLRGKDNVIRGAVVRIKGGSNISSFLRRPIQRLYPMEVRSFEGRGEEISSGERDGNVTGAREEEDSYDSQSVDMSPPPEPSAGSIPPTHPISTRRSSRRAALEARDRIIARLMD